MLRDARIKAYFYDAEGDDQEVDTRLSDDFAHHLSLGHEDVMHECIS